MSVEMLVTYIELSSFLFDICILAESKGAYMS